MQTKVLPKNHLLIEILKKPQTVFRLQELSQIFAQTPEQDLVRMLSYYSQRGMLQRLRRGIYAKEKYSAQELANKIFTPSYISFVTVLEEQGLIFQQSQVIHSASYLTRDVTVHAQELIFHRVSDHILLNTRGIQREGFINKASTERAFLDTLYLFGEFHIDHFGPLNWQNVFDLLGLYEQKVLKKRVEKQYRLFKEE